MAREEVVKKMAVVSLFKTTNDNALHLSVDYGLLPSPHHLEITHRGMSETATQLRSNCATPHFTRRTALDFSMATVRRSWRGY
jgi:hypothetical protein